MSDDFTKQIPSLRAYSRALCRTVADAEDLVQETLLRAIENAHHYQPGTNLRAWLFTIMRNKFYTNCQKAARERRGAQASAPLVVESVSNQEWHMEAREVQAAMRDMPDHYREAIMLVGVLGESYLDAARILEVDIGTIKSRVNRARSFLRKAMEPAL